MERQGFSNVVVKLVLSFTMALILGSPGVSALGAEADRRVVINIPSRTLWVYENDRIVRWFPVGVGRPGFPTPTGKYKVIRKIVNPIWEHPYKAAGAVRIGVGPQNPLGTRWIGFKEYKGGEYGIHGTDNPSSVGKFSSHGCVRMKIKDAEVLFDMVKMGMPLEVSYETVLVRPEGDAMRLVVYPDAFGKGMPKVEEVREKVLDQYPNAEVDDALIGQALAQPAQKPFVVGRLLSDVEMADKHKDLIEENPDKPLRPLLQPVQPAKPEQTPEQTKEEVRKKIKSARENKPEGKPIPVPKDIVTKEVAPVPPSAMSQLESAVERDYSPADLSNSD